MVVHLIFFGVCWYYLVNFLCAFRFLYLLTRCQRHNILPVGIRTNFKDFLNIFDPCTELCIFSSQTDDIVRTSSNDLTYVILFSEYPLTYFINFFTIILITDVLILDLFTYRFEIAERFHQTLISLQFYL